MDAPIVAAKTGAVLIGSKSTANIARGLDFPEEPYPRDQGRRIVHLRAVQDHCDQIAAHDTRVA